LKISSRFYVALAALLIVTGATAFGATAKIEGTPVPVTPKPDFSGLQFLIGTWQCTDLSSRRPGPFGVTEVYSMDSTGYWLVRDDTTHKASWIPREFHAQTKFTYDALAKHWVRISLGDRGNYSVATAPNGVANAKTWTFVTQTKAPDIASYAPEVYVKVSDTKKTMTTSFTETDGRVVNVKETCTKS
jgi:hypothetical protein